MPEIEIRAAEASDAEALHEIFNCPSVIANTMQLPWQSLDKRRAWLTGHLADGSHLLVAAIDGRVVGNLGLDLQRAMRRRHVAGMGMSVHDDFQNRGVGSALMKAMIELADDWLGLERIELEVYVDNLPADPPVREIRICSRRCWATVRAATGRVCRRVLHEPLAAARHGRVAELLGGLARQAFAGVRC